MTKTSIKIAALILVAGSLQADTITQTNTFSGTPSYNRTLTFNEFDDNNGTYTLNSVTVSIVFDMLAGASLKIDNDADSASQGTVYLGANGTISSTNVRLWGIDTTVSTINSNTMTLAANDGDDPGSFQTGTIDYAEMITAFTSDTAGGSIDSYVFSDYIGTGTYVINFDANQYLNLSTLGGVSYSGTPLSTTGSVIVQYNYTIPEPATASLSILVLLAAVWIRRRFID